LIGFGSWIPKEISIINTAPIDRIIQKVTLSFINFFFNIGGNSNIAIKMEIAIMAKEDNTAVYSFSNCKND
jgi:hypothetical protein